MFEKILVCLDGSNLSEQILPFAEAQALKFNSKVILFQVVTTFPQTVLYGLGRPIRMPKIMQIKPKRILRKLQSIWKM